MRHGGTPSARKSVLLYVIMGVLVSSARMQRALLEDEPSQHTHTCSAVTLAVVGGKRVRGRTCHPPLFHRLLPLIAHWPAIARWNRDDESTYNLSPVTAGH